MLRAPSRRLPVMLSAIVATCVVAASGAVATVSASHAAPRVFEGPVPKARCGPGSLPETGLQGQVPLRDRQDGRSKKGYRCNLALVGQYQGEGMTWVDPSYGHCSYYAQTVPGSLAGKPGVGVIDVRRPAKPVLARMLKSPAFLGNTWESLKVNEKRGLLGGVSGTVLEGVAFFDLFDISKDCTRPRLLNSISNSDLSIPSNALGHEGNWSPDGKTYWASSANAGQLTAIDVSNPKQPRVLFTGYTGVTNHGFSLSNDGRRLYMANMSPDGLTILDVSQIQDRKPLPQIKELGSVFWTDGKTGQHALNVTWGGRPYVVFVDEGGAGAARIIDISNEKAPRIVSKLKLQIHMPQYADVRSADTLYDEGFGYEGHYCAADRAVNPTAIACGYFQSGIRVFDVRNPLKPREIAYYNPPAQSARKMQLYGSEHAYGINGPVSALNVDWCTSPPRFVGRQLWVTCQDSGFLVLRFTNGAYPLR